jgi:hypothetical protein
MLFKLYQLKTFGSSSSRHEKRSSSNTTNRKEKMYLFIFFKVKEEEFSGRKIEGSDMNLLHYLPIRHPS